MTVGFGSGFGGRVAGGAVADGMGVASTGGFAGAFTAGLAGALVVNGAAGFVAGFVATGGVPIFGLAVAEF